MARKSTGERVARLEERQKVTDERIKEFRADIKVQWNKIDEHFRRLNKMVNGNTESIKVINEELGQLRREHERFRQAIISKFDSLEDLVNSKVKAPMTGRDRAVLYGTVVTALSSLTGTIIMAVLNYLH